LQSHWFLYIIFIRFLCWVFPIMQKSLNINKTTTTQEQYAAINRVNELWKTLANTMSKQIIELRNNLLTNAQIAEILIPETYLKYPWVAARAVSHALLLVLWEERRNNQTYKVISNAGRSPQNIERLKDASKIWMETRIRKYWEAGVHDQQRKWFIKWIELQWKKVLSVEEKEFIIKLCESEDYRDKFWKIMRNAIANEVNKKFWNWENVRKPVAIADCYRRYGHNKVA
jgi:hypothetical protein